MARPKLPSQKKAYAALRGRINQYTMLVQGVFDTLAKEGTSLAAKTGYEGEAPFSFKDYPQTADAVRKMQEEYVSGISGIIHRSTAEEWKNSNLAQDLIADKAWAFYTATERGVRKSVYYQTNSDVLLAFQKRKDKGLGLSERLWGQSREYKEGLEAAISTAVEKGISAVALSKRVSQYLKDFPSMRKDYTRRYGKALDCRDCQYESIRLARTEINMAYRMAEQERWRQFDFVLAYDIKMSKSHRAKDICDDLAGRYPKTFTFKGWHPNCFCYCVPVLKTEDEFFGDVPVETRDDMPYKFRRWYEKNERRINGSSSLPYFLEDNRDLVEKIRKSMNVIARSSDVPCDFNAVRGMIYDTDSQQLLFNSEYLKKDGIYTANDLYCNLGGRETLKKRLEKISDNSAVYMSIDGSTLEKKIILGDGKFKNSLETGKGTFKTIGADRAVKEAEMFGLPKEPDCDLYPKYGFMSAADDMEFQEIVGWGYGDTFVRFRQGVKRRTSITLGDSYDGNTIVDVSGKRTYRKVTPAVPLTSPTEEFYLSLHKIGNKTLRDKIASASSFDKMGGIGTYVEAQIYGKTGIADVDTIFVSSKKVKAGLEKAIAKKGLDISLRTCKYDSRIEALKDGITDYEPKNRGYQLLVSMSPADVSKLGDGFIDRMCKRYASPSNGFWKKIDITELTSQIPRIAEGKATSAEKRAWMIRFYKELEKEGKGKFPKVWWQYRKKKLAGWTDDVLNEKLLKQDYVYWTDKR